jgi:amino acid transporter
LLTPDGCLISSAWSAGNADVYIAGRSLFSLANQGYLPKWFMYTLPNGTPIVASMAAAASGLLAYMAVDANANKVFNWFVNLISVGGIMIYVGIAWTYLRFRAACDAQGIDRAQFPFRSPFARVGAWVCVVALPSKPPSG